LLDTLLVGIVNKLRDRPRFAVVNAQLLVIARPSDDIISLTKS
jgi:hypothetical protein